jgi:hypothetical protein
MDNTELYIKMCDKAVEIQDQQPEMGLAPLNNEKVFLGLNGNYWIGAMDWVEQQIYYIWLPKQDQLQNMIDNLFYTTKNNTGLINMVIGIDYWARMEKDIYLSMEQLWLAFMMREMYKKKWNGENWIKETN